MPEVLDDLAHLPVGAHALSFHVGRDEAADHAIAFLEGTPEGQSAIYWVVEPAQAEYYSERLAHESPEHVGCIAVLPTEQVERQDGKLRPVRPVLDFIHAHPEGVTACGETITHYWAPHNIPDHVEYEAWFEEQRRDWSRFLCPYDLRAIPPESAPRVIQELASHHSHVVLSGSDEPAVRLLQLFIFRTRGAVPAVLASALAWADGEGLLCPDEELELSERGNSVVRDWGRTAVLDW